MESFLGKIASHIINNYGSNTEELIIVLPSRRAGLFLKTELSKRIEKPIWMPQILAAEDFVEYVSGIKVLDNVSLLFELYNACKQVDGENIEPFESFSKWGHLMLYDFNEVDRYLINPDYLFSYLEEAKKLESWGVGDEAEATTLIKSYLKFWKSLGKYYKALNNNLLAKKQGYQGMAYRQVAENPDKVHLKISQEGKKILFAGLNALNKAEEQIIDYLLTEGIAEIFWDADEYYLHNPKHEAGLFLRNHRANRKLPKGSAFNWVENSLQKDKKIIEVIGVAGQIGQAKIAGNILQKELSPKLQDTAIVLADENLLLPTLNSLPKTVDKVNVTMGYPLKNVPLTQFFEVFFSLHSQVERYRESVDKTARFYHKDVNALLENSYTMAILGNSVSGALVSDIIKRNMAFVSYRDLEKLSQKMEHKNENVLQLLFEDSKNDANTLLGRLSALITLLKDTFSEQKTSNSSIELEYLFHFSKILNRLKSLQTEYGFISDNKTLQSFFKQLVNTDTLSFFGEPLSGLQLMGMLETRALDFKTIILTAVNEGTLPSGKTANSLIPYDIKKETGLPTYEEKDAVYAYHFYRLLQRAENIYLLYNTETDAFGSGEQSRFITQLENELVHINPNIQFNKTLYNAPVRQNEPNSFEIVKTAPILERLDELAEKGFSPSSLATYIRNPLDFYHKKVLGIDDTDELEETVAANTLGQVIHDTLEELYRPLIGFEIDHEAIKALKKEVPNLVTKYFEQHFKNGDIKSGKNLLTYSVAIRFITNFLKAEQRKLKAENAKLEIVGLEQEFEVYLPLKNLDKTVKIRGIIDRIDRLNGQTRIIDYKTGFVEPRTLKVDEIELPFTDPDYGKPFQLLMYAYFYLKNNPDAEISSGIFSLRKPSSYLMELILNGNNNLTSADITDIENCLIRLIEELYNTAIPFRTRDEEIVAN